MTVGLEKRHSCDERVTKETIPGTRQSFIQIEAFIARLAKKSQESEKHQKLTSGMALLEKLSLQYILYAFFVDMNFQPLIGEKITVSGVMREYRLRRTHRNLLHTLFGRLEDFGILTKSPTENSWTVSNLPPPAEKIIASIKQIQTGLTKYPECSTEAEFVNYSGSQLYPVLRGKITGLDVLFPPDTSPDFQYGAQELYANSALMENTKTIYIAHGVLEIVRNLVAQGQKEIRILEIGAGTGATTVPVLKALSADILNATVNYTFTDISNFFVGKAKERIESAYPAIKMEFKSLDIEEDAKEGEKYDLVIAADVFHATQYLDDTLRHTRSYMKAGGFLVLGEIFNSSIMLEITFGLTEGWWRFADEVRVHSSPLVTNGEWEEAVKKFGCSDAFSVSNGTFGVVFAQADSSA